MSNLVEWTGTAIFSPDKKYRYTLTRTWDEHNPKRCLFICLNPSTATETVNDPTIRRCIGFAQSWGYGSYYLGNLFAYRATNPKDMKAQEDPIGPDNDKHLLEMALEVKFWNGDIVCAWGTHGTHMYRAEDFLWRMKHAKIPLKALKLTKDGMPCHPLYLKGDLKPASWSYGNETV